AGQGGVAHHGADPQAAVLLADLVERQARDIDDVLGRLGVDLHQVQQVGAAGQELGAGPAYRHQGGRHVDRAFVGEGAHGLGLSGVEDGGDDVGIGGTAADVAAHALAHLVFVHVDHRLLEVGGDRRRQAALQ